MQRNDEILRILLVHVNKPKKLEGMNLFNELLNSLKDLKALSQTLNIPLWEIKAFSRHFMEAFLESIVKALARKNHRSKEEVFRKMCKRYLPELKGESL